MPFSYRSSTDRPAVHVWVCARVMPLIISVSTDFWHLLCKWLQVCTHPSWNCFKVKQKVECRGALGDVVVCPSRGCPGYWCNAHSTSRSCVDSADQKWEVSITVFNISLFLVKTKASMQWVISTLSFFLVYQQFGFTKLWMHPQFLPLRNNTFIFFHPSPKCPCSPLMV